MVLLCPGQAHGDQGGLSGPGQEAREARGRCRHCKVLLLLLLRSLLLSLLIMMVLLVYVSLRLSSKLAGNAAAAAGWAVPVAQLPRTLLLDLLHQKLLVMLLTITLLLPPGGGMSHCPRYECLRWNGSAESHVQERQSGTSHARSCCSGLGRSVMRR